MGATRLFFDTSLPSSFSPSPAASLLAPAELRGVSGGVVVVAAADPLDFPPLEPVRAGTVPAISGGLLTTPGRANEDDCVATDEVEFDRAGGDGRCDTAVVAVAGGDGAVKELTELRCW